MSHKVAWAQIIKDTKITIDCPYCEKTKGIWRVNGRTAGLTRTLTTYVCDSCISLALEDLRWE